MEKNEEMLEFEFLDELEDKPEIPDKVNYENEYYEYFKDINEIIRNSEHPKWDIVKATIKEAARDTFEKISFGVTNNRFVNGFKDRWNEMASKGYAFKENTIKHILICQSMNITSLQTEKSLSLIFLRFLYLNFRSKTLLWI